MSRKFKSYRKYNYKEGGGKNKKIVIISLIALVAIIAVAAITFTFTTIIPVLNGDNSNDGTTPLSIQSTPNKTTYYVGETPSWHGLKVKLVTEDGNSVILSPENCTIIGFDSSAPAESQVITVKYKDYTTKFTVSILDKSEQQQQQKPTAQFTNLSFKTLPKTTYKVAEWLSVKDGLLLLQYDDGTTKEIELTYEMVSGFNTSKPGTYTLTVKYKEGNKSVSTTYDITVTN